MLGANHYQCYRRTNTCSNRELQELFDQGFGIHHAGMLRTDRSLTERLFADGLIKVSPAQSELIAQSLKDAVSKLPSMSFRACTCTVCT
jgi:glutamine phosphoribosylpyrophosphate amidotransferase